VRCCSSRSVGANRLRPRQMAAAHQPRCCRGDGGDTTVARPHAWGVPRHEDELQLARDFSLAMCAVAQPMGLFWVRLALGDRMIATWAAWRRALRTHADSYGCELRLSTLARAIGQRPACISFLNEVPFSIAAVDSGGPIRFSGLFENAPLRPMALPWPPSCWRPVDSDASGRRPSSDAARHVVTPFCRSLRFHQS